MPAPRPRHARATPAPPSCSPRYWVGRNLDPGDSVACDAVARTGNVSMIVLPTFVHGWGTSLWCVTYFTVVRTAEAQYYSTQPCNINHPPRGITLEMVVSLSTTTLLAPGQGCP
eukprot:gene23547-biopygen4340